MAKFEDALDEFLERQLEDIHEQIAAIDRSKTVQAAQALLAKKARLQAAERALLGAGSKTTGGDGGGRVTQAQVVANMEVGRLYSVEELAEKMGTTDIVVRGHLNRGNGERFITPSRGVWGLRDPEAGFSGPGDYLEVLASTDGDDD
jgi:hypothetical protein